MTPLSKYLFFRAHQSVDGWLLDGAAWATYLISEWQTAQRLHGDVAEIGVHHGRYFILLSLLSADEEKAVAIDIFENQELNVDRSGAGDLRQFLENFDKFDGRRSKLIVHKSDSLQLKNRDLLHAERPPMASLRRTFRLFSVDGSHTADHTINDIEVAFSVLRPGGMVIVDDFYNPHWPGVQEGVHALLSERKEICAVGYGENKLFLTTIEDHAVYLDLLRSKLRPFYSDSKLISLHGKTALFFSMGDPRRHFDGELRRIKWEGSFGRTNHGHDLTVDLIEGWSARETNGVWVSAPLATAKIHLPEEFTEYVGPLTVSVWIYPYLHHRRSSRTIRAFTNGGATAGREINGGTILRLQSAHTVVAGREIWLTVAADTPDIPADVDPTSSDQRPLSFFVSRVEITLGTGGLPG